MSDLARRLRDISQQIDDWAAFKIGLIDWGHNQVTIDEAAAAVERAEDAEVRLGECLDASKEAWAKHGGTEIALGQWKARAEHAERELAEARAFIASSPATPSVSDEQREMKQPQ